MLAFGRLWAYISLSQAPVVLLRVFAFRLSTDRCASPQVRILNLPSAMTNTLHPYPPAVDTANEHIATHEAIAARARELWLEQGCPENCDQAIWLEAEAELLAIEQKRYRHPHLQLTNPQDSQSRKDLHHAQ